MKDAIYQINSTSQQLNNLKAIPITTMAEKLFIMMKSYFNIIKCTFKLLCNTYKPGTTFQDITSLKHRSVCK